MTDTNQSSSHGREAPGLTHHRSSQGKHKVGRLRPFRPAPGPFLLGRDERRTPGSGAPSPSQAVTARTLSGGVSGGIRPPCPAVSGGIRRPYPAVCPAPCPAVCPAPCPAVSERPVRWCPDALSGGVSGGVSRRPVRQCVRRCPGALSGGVSGRSHGSSKPPVQLIPLSLAHRGRSMNGRDRSPASGGRCSQVTAASW